MNFISASARQSIGTSGPWAVFGGGAHGERVKREPITQESGAKPAAE